MSDHPFVYAAYFYRTPAAFRIFIRGWTDERLEAEQKNAKKYLPAHLADAYQAELVYRRMSFCRGALRE